MNIYEKQKKKLGLTTREYAQLLNMPYEVVKDIIYEKEGDYSMEVKNVLRNNMFNRHQEIENNEDTKIKVLEIKNKEIDYLDWYNKEYTKEMLFDKLKVKSVADFENKYYIEVNNKKASHWFYTTIVPKISYAGHEIQKDKKREFVKQLYDIIVNDNEEQYLIKDTNLQKQFETHVHNKKYYSGKKIYGSYIMDWYKNFDFKKYLNDNHMTQLDLSKRTGISTSTLNNLINRQATMTYTTTQMEELYKYFYSTGAINKTNNLDFSVSNFIDEQTKDDEDEKNIEVCGSWFSKKEYDKLSGKEARDDILRKLLINRLTEEEKMLIELFGGKIC